MNLSLLALGFLIGMRHAVEADHVAAVASLATKNTSLRDTIKHGAVWGIGHTITLFIFGSVALLADSIIPQDLASILEFAVGIMLLLLGLDVLYRLYKKRIHFHTHKHDDGIKHFHVHSHAGEISHSESSHQHKHVKRFPRRALFVGLMHGMAGSAALIIITLQSVQSLYMGLVYIALFGVGSIAGMAILSTIIAIPLCYSSKNLTWAYNALHIVIAIVTLAVGSVMIGDYIQSVA